MERKGIFGTLADDGGWKVNTAGSMLSGAAAGFMSSLVRGPAERVKTVLQAGHGQGASGGSWHCAKHLIAFDGAFKPRELRCFGADVQYP
eukprot:jgi/Tetstr1/421187/TSEL_012228.t1